MTPDALEKLARAREATKGISPRARGEEKARVALDWIYRWGWSSPAILDLVTGGNRTGLSARLVRRKLVASTKTASGGGAKGVPIYMLTLTTQGLEEVERFREELVRYELDPYRIDQSKLRHDHISQKATGESLKNGAIKDFRTPNELASQSAKGIKQPDVLWLRTDGQRMGIEVELTAKWDRKLDQFVMACLHSLQKSSDASKPNEVDEVAIVTDSMAILKRYTKAFEPGERLPRWTKNERGLWVQKDVIEVPAWVEGKVVCELID